MKRAEFGDLSECRGKNQKGVRPEKQLQGLKVGTDHALDVKPVVGSCQSSRTMHSSEAVWPASAEGHGGTDRRGVARRGPGDRWQELRATHSGEPAAAAAAPPPTALFIFVLRISGLCPLAEPNKCELN